MSELDPSATTGADFVQFPDDSTNTGKKILYAQEVIDDVTVYLPTTVLVDEDGNAVDLVKSLEQQNATMLSLLRAICLRLDILNAAVSDNYAPPDQLAEET